MIGQGRAPCDEGIVRAGTASAVPASRTRNAVLAATILGSSLAFIDGSVVNVALPAIQAELAGSVEDAQWVVNGYLLTLGALVLVGGAAGDRFGRRRLFIWGIVLFTLASILCGIAPNSVTLVAARAVQGIGSAMLVPNSLAIISACFPSSERGRAIGSWAGFSALTMALGPLVGGWLVDGWSWRAIFFLNVPVALLTLGLTVARVPESRAADAPAPIDWIGGILAMLGLAGLAYGLSAATHLGWGDAAVIGTLFAGIAIIAIFVWFESHAAAPMVPLHLFRSRNFSGANAITLLLYFALAGALFFLPFDLIRLQNYSAARTGAAFLPLTIVMGGLSRWSGGLADRYGARAPLTIGPVIAAAGYALLAVPGIGASYWTGFFPAMVVLGFGMAVSVAPLTSTVMGAVPERHVGAASGINNAVARIASLLAVALLGALAVAIFGTALERRLDALAAPPAIRQALAAEIPRLAEAQLPDNVTGAERQRLERALGESFLHSFRIVMLIAAGLALCSALCGRLMIADRPAQSAADT